MEQLQNLLAQHNVPTTTLKTLRDVVIETNSEFEDIAETIIEKKHPVYTLRTQPTDLLSLWDKLEKAQPHTGYSPVFFGSYASVQRHWENQEEGTRETPEAYLSLATAFNAEKWLQKRWQKVVDGIEAEMMGQVPQKASPMTQVDFATLDTNATDTEQDVFIGLLPTINRWKIPALLPFGCWNDCPCPEFQVAVHQYWHDKYESKIVAILSDVLICRVGKPVQTHAAAVQLAKEQTAYCSDIVFQGVGTVNQLAANLVGSTYWYFWWD
jgi:hypothetical protein